MSVTQELTDELFELNPENPRDKVLLDDAVDVSNTYKVANVFGNYNPRPPKKFLKDHKLQGTGTLAWYLDPQEIKRYDYRAGMELESKLGPHPVIAYNPDIRDENDRKYVMAIDAHEKAHGGQQGKMALKQIVAKTKYGDIPLGLMLIEGGVEWALERGGFKPPTRYMDARSSRTPMYSHFRNFVYEIEEKQHGIMRQVYRAAERAGPYAAMRLLEGVPGIQQLVNKYAAKLSRPSQRLAA